MNTKQQWTREWEGRNCCPLLENYFVARLIKTLFIMQLDQETFYLTTEDTN